MRLVIKKDKKISEDEMQELQRQFTDFMYEHAGITPTFFIEDHEYTNVPLETDSDGDKKPTDAYRKAVADDVHDRYGEWGTDHIILLVHQDNWVYTGIWGTNWSNIFYSYHMELCRFDKRNMANSFGTLYHEVHHSLDALVKTTTGFDVNTLFTVRWDEITHGKEPWKYIRYKENIESIEKIAPYLRQSYQKRKELHDARVLQLNTVITLLQKIVLLTRTVLNKKDGVRRTT